MVAGSKTRAPDAGRLAIEELMARGKQAASAGNTAQALACFQAAAKQAPKASGPRLSAADLLRDLGRLDDAQVQYLSVLGFEPANVPARMGLASISWTRKDPKSAAMHLRAARSSEPQNLEVLMQLGNVSRHAARTAEAQEAYEAVIAIDADHAAALTFLGFLARGRGRAEEALAYCRRAAASGRGMPPLVAQQLAASLRLLGRTDEAEAVCKSALAKVPGNVLLLYELGCLARIKRDFKAAAECFEAVSTAVPANLNFRVQLGKSHSDLLQLDQAETVYRSVLEAQPNNVEAINGLGEAARLRGNSELALRYFEEAIKHSPHDVFAARAIRQLKIGKGEFDWRTEIDEAVTVARTPNSSPSAQLYAASVLVQHGITELARPLLLRLADDNAEARQLLLAIKEIERMGIAQPIPTEGAFEDPGEGQLDTLQGFHERPVAGSDAMLIVFPGENTRAWLTFSLLHRILRATNVSAVYVRDLRQTYYASGIAGLGEDYESTVRAFKDLAARYGARRILTIGNCYGCGAALHYGLSLGAQGVLGLAPSFALIDDGQKPEFVARARAARKMLPADQDDFHRRYLEAAARPSVTLLYGQEYRPDALSAQMMADVPGVRLAGLPGAATHDTIKDLLIRRLLSPVLSEFVANGEISAGTFDRILTSRNP